MLLNTETIVNDSKKISELRKLTKVTKHQENTWIPIAQYNSRTNTYINAAINLQAITSYNSDAIYSYVADEFGSYWIQFRDIGKETTYAGIGNKINELDFASNILSYTLMQASHQLDWQIVNGSYIPQYHVPLDPDDLTSTPKPMELPEGYEKDE